MIRNTLGNALGFAATLLVLSANVASAQGASSKPTVMTATSMPDAVKQLIAKYGYPITMEMPRYEFDGDLEDMPVEHRRDLANYPPGQAPRVRMARMGEAYSLTIPATTSAQRTDVASRLAELVQIQSTRGYGAHYRVEQADNTFHIIPTEVRDENGNWVVQDPILDARISITKEERSVLDSVSSICEAVGVARGVSVQLLQAPMTMLHYSRNDVGASEEPARSVLTRALSGLSTKLTWRVFYDESLKSYLLSVFVVPDGSLPGAAPASAVTSPQPPVDPHAPRTGSAHK